MKEQIMIVVEKLDKGFIATSPAAGHVGLSDTESLQKELNAIVDHFISIATKDGMLRRFTITISLTSGRTIDNPEM